MEDPTYGALYYHADYVNPRWKNLNHSTTIGRHIFYVPKGIGGLKGLQEAYKLQEEYKVAKSGVQSRYGKFAKAFGLTDEKGAAMLDKFFGKEVPKEELEKMREKFKIKDSKADESKSKATKGLKKQSEKSKLRDEQITKIYELSEKIHEIVGGIKSSVDGIANKLRASPAKDAPKSKKEMRKLGKKPRMYFVLSTPDIDWF